MNQKNRPGNFQTLLFFVGFIILFFLVFALGVIVGKGLTDFESLLSQNERGQLLTNSVKSIFRINEPENSAKNYSDTSSEKKAQIEVVKILENNNETNQENSEAVTIIEDVAEKEDLKVEVTEKEEVKVEDTKKGKIPDKEIPDKKDVKTEKTKLEKTADVEEKIAEKETVSEKVAADPDKEDKSDYVAKIDYSIPEFPKTDPGGKYTVQLGSFQNIDTAYKLEKSLNEKGYPSFVIKAAIPEKGTWYRVRVGTFNNKDKARDYAEKIKSKEKLEFTQITLNN